MGRSRRTVRDGRFPGEGTHEPISPPRRASGPSGTGLPHLPRPVSRGRWLGSTISVFSSRLLDLSAAGVAAGAGADGRAAAFDGAGAGSSSSSGMMSTCSGSSSIASSNSSTSRSSSATGSASSSAVSWGLGPGAASRGSRARLDGIDAEGHSADGQDIAGLERLLPEDAFPVDEGPVGTPEIAKHEPLAVLEKLAVPAADLGGPDPDETIIVAADAVDPVDQPQRIRFAASPDDLKNVVHDLGNPGKLADRYAREFERREARLSSSYPFDWRHANGKPESDVRSRELAAPTWSGARAFPPKAPCIPGGQRYTGKVADARCPSGSLDGAGSLASGIAGVAQG